jgi:hypothetical protein
MFAAPLTLHLERAATTDAKDIALRRELSGYVVKRRPTLYVSMRDALFPSRNNIDAWLNPNPKDLAALYAILDDRDRPYYEHRLAVCVGGAVAQIEVKRKATTAYLAG